MAKPLKFSVNKFPKNADVKNASGLPWGCVVQPLSHLIASDTKRHEKSMEDAENWIRCPNCFAYLNILSAFFEGRWQCSLCKTVSDLPDPKWFNKNANAAELQSEDVEAMIEEHEYIPSQSNPSLFGQEGENMDPMMNHRPIVIALVDCSTQNALTTMKDGLLASLEAIHPLSLFGLVTFADELSIYDFGEVLLLPGVDVISRPHALSVPIPTEEEPIKLKMSEILPINRWLVPLDRARNSIVEAIESIEYNEDSTIKRGYGTALHYILNTLKSHESFDAGITILTFKGGIPNYGLGNLSTNNTTTDWSPLPSPITTTTNPPKSVLSYLDPRNLLDLIWGGGESEHENLLPVAMVSRDRDMRIHKKDTDNLSPTTNFYREMGLLANEIGVTVHMFEICQGQNDSESNIGLPSTKFLSVCTNGHVYYYDITPMTDSIGIRTDKSDLKSEVHAPIAQDVFRCLQNRAINVEMRLRTSDEFGLANAYGCISSDPIFGDIFRMTSAGHRDSAAFDFAFTGLAGFEDLIEEYSRHGAEDESRGVIQLAVKYSIVDGGSSKVSIRRYIRVYSCESNLSYHVHDMYRSVDPEVSAYLLVQKIIRASLDSSISEARSLLSDWLCVLMGQYNRSIIPLLSHNVDSFGEYSSGNNARNFGVRGNSGYNSIDALGATDFISNHTTTTTTKKENNNLKIDELDCSLSKFKGLQYMSRYVLGMLKSKVFAPSMVSNDYRIYLQLLCQQIEPISLLRMIYPFLSAYDADGVKIHDRLVLSTGAVRASSAPIYVIDTYDNIIGYQTSEDVSFKLKAIISDMRKAKGRHVVPRVVLTSGSDSKPFMDRLVEDANISGISYSELMESSSVAVLRYLSNN